MPPVFFIKSYTSENFIPELHFSLDINKSLFYYSVMEVTLGTIITNRLRESGKTPTDISRELDISTAYIFRIIHGSIKSWSPGAMRIRKAIADQLHTTPENLWPQISHTPVKKRKY